MKKDFKFSIVALSILLAACNGSGGDKKSLAEKFNFDPQTQAKENDIHESVFISAVNLSGVDLANIKNIAFKITPKEGTFSEAVQATYSLEYLKKNDKIDADGNITLPVFGLYSDFGNDVQVTYQFSDDSTYSFSQKIVTEKFIDPKNIYDNVTIELAPTATPEFSFFAMKSAIYPPVVMDIDGNVRWFIDETAIGSAAHFQDNMFYVGRPYESPHAPLPTTKFGIDTYSLFGDKSHIDLKGSSLTESEFHHNIDIGKHGLLIELNGKINGIRKTESHLTEISHDGQVLKEWDFGKIISDYMLSEGDDPSNFVRDGVDWFHINAAAYDPSDDSIIASSRENFIAKFDYETGNILWVFGDETKHWATYPSLQKLSVSLTGGEKPNGQHAISITKSGDIMFFNNGQVSFNQPAGSPVGTPLTSSLAEVVRIDSTSKQGEVIWQYDADIYSDICSSVYESRSASQKLINYAVAENRTKLILLAVNKQKEKLFKYTLPSKVPCQTSWNAQVIALDAVKFQ